MSDNIPPYEIQLEIMKRVSDVKSLLRFRAVSKQWKSFIDSSEFITGYGVRHTQPHRLLLRYTDNVDPYDVKYVSFIDDVTFPQQQLDFSPNVPLLIKQLYKSTVIGSSCGLWCLHGFKNWSTEMIVIWNPSIRKSVVIVLPLELTNISGKVTRFGFGVSPSTYDPTIVGIFKCFRDDKHKVGIFTLSSMTWKMIPTSNLLCTSVTFQLSTQVAIGRSIFWVAYDWIVGDDGISQYKSLILSFDLITHEFKEVSLPVSISNTTDISISKLNDSLVVCAYTAEVYGVWIMGKEGGVMTSFTKLFNINTPNDPPGRKVLGFTMSGELIMETENNDGEYATVEFYKPCIEQVKNLGINGKDCSFFICPCTETLLLVDRSDCSIISNDH